MGKILLLGEGNFTFALDLTELLVGVGNTDDLKLQNITATSIDQKHELIEKYPSIEKTFMDLDMHSQVQVIHGIDATKDLKSQLINASCTTIVFDYIIFNFPHLGYEDMHHHSSLIAHILYR